MGADLTRVNYFGNVAFDHMDWCCQWPTVAAILRFGGMTVESFERHLKLWPADRVFSQRNAVKKIEVG